MTFRFSGRSSERLSGVDERLQEIANLAITLTKIDFGIPAYGGIRTAPEQARLYGKGKSNCDGYEKLSRHQSGMALDVYAYVDGKASWDKYHLSMVATAMLQTASILGYKLSWGGLWDNFVDMPHFELVEE